MPRVLRHVLLVLAVLGVGACTPAEAERVAAVLAESPPPAPPATVAAPAASCCDAEQVRYLEAVAWAAAERAEFDRLYAVWGPIHECESHDWFLDARYDGGLQFDPATWRDADAGGLRYAAFAYQASPLEQMRVAQNWWDAIARESGADAAWRQWPRCSAEVGYR